MANSTVHLSGREIAVVLDAFDEADLHDPAGQPARDMLRAKITAATELGAAEVQYKEAIERYREIKEEAAEVPTDGD